MWRKLCAFLSATPAPIKKRGASLAASVLGAITTPTPTSAPRARADLHLGLTSLMVLMMLFFLAYHARWFFVRAPKKTAAAATATTTPSPSTRVFFASGVSVILADADIMACLGFVPKTVKTILCRSYKGFSKMAAKMTLVAADSAVQVRCPLCFMHLLCLCD